MRCSPSTSFHAGANPTVCLSVSLDALSVVPWSEPAENLGPILGASVARQLKLLVEDLKQQLVERVDGDVDGLRLPEVLHFWPEPLRHPVTLAFHPQHTDKDLGSISSIFFLPH